MARPGMDRNVKFKALVRLLGLPRPYVRGLLDTMWDVAHETGNPVLGSPDDVEAAAEWPGERGVFFAALRSLRWIDQRPDGQWEIHDYWDHAPEYVAGRAQREAERQKEKTCERCGAPYHSPDARSKYCSPRCRTAKWRGHVTECGGAVRHGDGALRTVTECDGSPAPAPAPVTGTGEVSPVTPLARRPPGGGSGLSDAATDQPTEAGDHTANVSPRPGRSKDRGGRAQAPDHATALDPAGDSVVLTFPVVGGKRRGGPAEWPLTVSKLAEYAGSFPGVNVDLEARKALQWCRDNPTKRKTPRGMPAFLYRWFSRAQDADAARARSGGYEPSRIVGPVSRVRAPAGKYDGVSRPAGSRAAAAGDAGGIPEGSAGGAAEHRGDTAGAAG